ncbi:hypothetical protein TEA_012755 [Camellia sinensis var. sinensis]|uniref:Uncharacterized protein n=1 Tax=Camellia sinensis var. sinensis TaxID=542762 RepID=A0A4S4DY77_CAMSN|nr:hypothetical protein TEA_012755 [Camellia sinensis var. sinensis]
MSPLKQNQPKQYRVIADSQVRLLVMPQRMKKRVTRRMKKKKLVYNWVPFVVSKSILKKTRFDDESLRRWKEQLFGSVDVNAVEETLEPNVKILSLTALCPGRSDLVFEIPANEDPKGVWFTLKENTCYHMRFSIQVSNNIVSGLSYINTVWKTVDSSKQMLGIFSPQVVPYIYEMPEEIILYEMMNLTLSNVMSDRAQPLHDKASSEGISGNSLSNK